MSPRASMVGFALGLGLLAAWSCRSDVPQEVMLDTGGSAAIDYGECEPGEELPCTCANGAAGSQLCLESGYERGPCLCGGPPPPADTGPVTDTGSASTGTGSTGTDGTGTGSSGTGLDTASSG
ncbi:MAG: hypothetical protein H6712_04125 [Myxococcales bacterium]|nr:hypothetical protein [Myxococcales bacterium]MCB9713015.1 hypothetical protein [Myxococcales bacterium]